MAGRISKIDYYLDIAIATSKRSTCLDKQVGCVIIDDRGIICGTGYNGAPRGMANCIDFGVCQVKIKESKLWCVAAHAEQNALITVPYGRAYACYCTLEPCAVCTSLLINAGCKHVFFLTKTKHSGQWLWENVYDSATWRHQPR